MLVPLLLYPPCSTSVATAVMDMPTRASTPSPKQKSCQHKNLINSQLQAAGCNRGAGQRVVNLRTCTQLLGLPQIEDAVKLWKVHRWPQAAVACTCCLIPSHGGDSGSKHCCWCGCRGLKYNAANTIKLRSQALVNDCCTRGCRSILLGALQLKDEGNTSNTRMKINAYTVSRS